MYHIELRQSMHNTCHFNLTEQELFDKVVGAWAQGQWIEAGERKWNPHQARLTVLEGPRLPVEQLSMGRGWRNARRQGEDVTERVVAQAKRASQPGVASQAAVAAAAGDPTEQLLPLLGSDPAALLAAWRLAAERRPELAPSASLALAETALHSLDVSPD